MTACARERDSQPPVWGSWCVVTDEAAAATAAAMLTEAETEATAAFETMTKTDGNMREQENSIRILQFTYELHTNAHSHKHIDTLTCLYTLTHTLTIISFCGNWLVLANEVSNIIKTIK